MRLVAFEFFDDIFVPKEFVVAEVLAECGFDVGAKEWRLNVGL